MQGQAVAEVEFEFDSRPRRRRGIQGAEIDEGRRSVADHGSTAIAAVAEQIAPAVQARSTDCFASAEG